MNTDRMLGIFNRESKTEPAARSWRPRTLVMTGAAILVPLLALAIIPSWRKSCACDSGRGSAAVIALKTISAANATYSSTFHQGFAGTLTRLGPPAPGCGYWSEACADLLDPVLSGVKPSAAAPTMDGYMFIYAAPSARPSPVAPNHTYSVIAVPAPGQSKNIATYCVDQKNVILEDPTGSATTPASPSEGCAGFQGDPL